MLLSVLYSADSPITPPPRPIRGSPVVVYQSLFLYTVSTSSSPFSPFSPFSLFTLYTASLYTHCLSSHALIASSGPRPSEASPPTTPCSLLLPPAPRLASPSKTLSSCPSPISSANAPLPMLNRTLRPKSVTIRSIVTQIARSLPRRPRRKAPSAIPILLPLP